MCCTLLFTILPQFIFRRKKKKKLDWIFREKSYVVYNSKFLINTGHLKEVLFHSVYWEDLNV
jgi:hypothetical protein